MKLKFLLYGALFFGASFANAQTPVLTASFNEDGIALSGSAKEGRKAAAMGATGTTTIYNPIRNEYLGATNNTTGDGFYYIMFNKDDLLGTALQGNFAAEMLFRCDSKNSQTYTKGTGKSNYTCKFFSCTQAGGWGIKYYPGPWKDDRTNSFAGICAEYAVDVEGTNTYCNVITEEDNGHIETGRFYHIIAVFDKDAQKISMYMNGKLIGEKADPNMAYPASMPNIGSVKREEGMWLALGADPAGNTTPDAANNENNNRSTFVFAKIYDSALTAKEVAKLYEGEQVQYYVNTKPTTTSDMIWDVVALADGDIYDMSPYDELTTTDEIVTQYNEEQKRFETVWTPTSKSFASRSYTYDPTITDRLAQGMAIEVYAKANTSTPSATISPLSFQQDGTIGFEMTATGAIKFNYNQDGYLLTGGGAKALSLTANHTLNTDYTHYVVVKDFNHTYIYINGKLDKEYSLEAGTDVYDPALQSTKFSYARCQWFCYGGDTNNSNQTGKDYPFDGQISIGRVWGKVLTATDVVALYTQATSTSKQVTINGGEHATTTLPFFAIVPEGVTAYIVSNVTATTIEATEYAKAGDVIPYGIPVILKGEAGKTYTFEAADTRTAKILDLPLVNYLEGSFATKTVAENEVFGMTDNNIFKLVNAGTTITDCKAWIPVAKVPAPAASKSIVFSTPTKINTVVSKVEKEQYYDLQGKLVEKPTRGIYIKNGAKVFVK